MLISTRESSYRNHGEIVCFMKPLRLNGLLRTMKCNGLGSSGVGYGHGYAKWCPVDGKETSRFALLRVRRGGTNDFDADGRPPGREGALRLG